jgi:hypothetical protein
MKYMQIQIRNPIIPYRDPRQKWQCPGEPRPEDQMINIRDRRPILEMDPSLPVFAVDAGDGCAPLNTGVLECFVAEIDVVFSAHDSVDGGLGEG